MTAEPCGWVVDVPECEAYESLTPEQQVDVVQMAVNYLWNWTERTFGVCDVTIRPCRQQCTEGSPYSTWRAALVGGSWFNLACGRCGDVCGCSRTPAIRLPGPVQSVSQVIIDGVEFDPTKYRVDNDRFLVRLDGFEWPTCQDMLLPITEIGTFQISYTAGVPVPIGGLQSASLLACEFAKAVATPKECRLPSRIQNITRQGVTVTLIDTFENLEKGQTGLWLIDSWVASVMHPRQISRVYSPDVPRPRNRHTTWSV